MTTSAVNVAAHSGGPQQRKARSSCSAPRTSSAVPSPSINIGGEGEREGGGRPAQLVRRSPHAASNALATVLLQRAGGRRRRRRASLSTAAAAPAPSPKTNTNTTNVRPTLSCTSWAIDSGRCWPLGTRRARRAASPPSTPLGRRRARSRRAGDRRCRRRRRRAGLSEEDSCEVMYWSEFCHHRRDERSRRRRQRRRRRSVHFHSFSLFIFTFPLNFFNI